MDPAATRDAASPALRDLFAQDLDRACLLAFRALGDWSAAEDAVQEACIRCLKHPPEDASPAAVRGYFLRTVFRSALDAHRSEAARRSREEAVAACAEAPDAAPGDRAVQREVVRAAQREMQDLSPEVRAAVCLCCEEGLTIREAAGVLGAPFPTVAKRVRRGLRQLRERLAALGFGALPPLALARALASGGLPTPPVHLVGLLGGPASAARALPLARGVPEALGSAARARLLTGALAAGLGAAALALGLIAPEGREAVPALVKTLDDEDVHVRCCAVEALGEIGPDAKEAVPVLEKLLEAWDENIRDAATRALKRIRGEEPAPDAPEESP